MLPLGWSSSISRADWYALVGTAALNEAGSGPGGALEQQPALALVYGRAACSDPQAARQVRSFPSGLGGAAANLALFAGAGCPAPSSSRWWAAGTRLGRPARALHGRPGRQAAVARPALLGRAARRARGGFILNSDIALLKDIAVSNAATGRVTATGRGDRPRPRLRLRDRMRLYVAKGQNRGQKERAARGSLA